MWMRAQGLLSYLIFYLVSLGRCLDATTDTTQRYIFIFDLTSLYYIASGGDIFNEL
jgi:hypothetical protein